MTTLKEIVQFLPTDMEWDNWNGNLLHYYGEEPIPYVDEDNWKTTANFLAGLATFSNYLVPDADTYDDWREWAKDFIESVNGPTKQGNPFDFYA